MGEAKSQLASSVDGQFHFIGHLTRCKLEPIVCVRVCHNPHVSRTHDRRAVNLVRARQRGHKRHAMTHVDVRSARSGLVGVINAVHKEHNDNFVSNTLLYVRVAY